jgi:hypothetical protein
MNDEGVEMSDFVRPTGLVHPERQPESFTEEELKKLIEDNNDILSDQERQSEHEYASKQLGLLHLLLEAKLNPKRALDILIDYKKMQILLNKQGPPIFRKGPSVESFLEKQLADLMSEKESREEVSLRDFFMSPAGAAAAVSESSDGKGEVFGSSGSSGSSVGSWGKLFNSSGGKKSMNLKKSKSKSKSKSRKSRRKSRKSRRKSRKLKSKY